MGRHERPEKPDLPNTILHQGARPLPDGSIETMVIVRLNDCNYQFSKVISLAEYQVVLEGWKLCAKTAIHQIHQRAVTAAVQERDAESSSPKSGSAPPAAPERFNGGSTENSKAPGAPT